MAVGAKSLRIELVGCGGRGMGRSEADLDGVVVLGVMRSSKVSEESARIVFSVGEGGGSQA